MNERDIMPCRNRENCLIGARLQEDGELIDIMCVFWKYCDQYEGQEWKRSTIRKIVNETNQNAWWSGNRKGDGE